MQGNLIYVDMLLAALMIVSAIAAMWTTRLVSAIILTGVISLVASYLFLRMGAPDVALTEAAIGAGLTTVIYLISLRRTRVREEEQS